MGDSVANPVDCDTRDGCTKQDATAGAVHHFFDPKQGPEITVGSLQSKSSYPDQSSNYICGNSCSPYQSYRAYYKADSAAGHYCP